MNRIGTMQMHSDEPIWEPPVRMEDWTLFNLAKAPEGTLEKAKSIVRTCPCCGNKESANEILAAIFWNGACDACCDDYDRKKKAPEQILALDSKLTENIPPLYRDTDRGRLENEKDSRQVSEVMAWEHTPRAKSVALVGDTRTGKTRTLCLLLEKMIKEGKTIRCFFHGSFADELMDVMRSNRSYRDWKRKIAQADYLAIDDLFSEKLTERCEAALFEVLDERVCHYRPTFITTQITFKDAKKFFNSQKRAEAFFARLKEFFTVIPCGKPIQEELAVG